MTLGTSIFLSALLLGVIALYIATKDRWNWKKIILWPFFGITVLSILAGLGLYIYSQIQDRPAVQNTFWDIPLSSTKEDVIFLKGAPTKRDKDGRWIYRLKREFGRESAFTIQFKENNIHYVACLGTDFLTSPHLQGMRVGSKYESMINKFGRPSFVSRSEDELERILSFENYNVFFWLEQNKVISYGMYNPRFGPVEFRKKKRE